MKRVDEFDRTGEVATDAEIQELLVFAETRYPALAKDIRSAIAGGQDYKLLYRILVDDMRRIQGGRHPRYVSYQILPTDKLPG